MKKIIVLLLCVIPMFSLMVPVYAEEETSEFDFQLEIDVNKRYTDISEMDEYNEEFFQDAFEDEKIKESNKIIYIAILSVLLVIAVIVLIVSLRRVPDAEDEVEKKSENTALSEKKKITSTSLADEEKSDEENDAAVESADEQTENSGTEA